MKSDSGLKTEMELESKLRVSLGENRYSRKAVISLSDPQTGRRAPTTVAKADSRKPR